MTPMSPNLWEHSFYEDRICLPIKSGTPKRKMFDQYSPPAEQFLDNSMTNAASHDRSNVKDALDRREFTSAVYPRPHLTVLDNVGVPTWQRPGQPAGQKRIKRSMSMIDSMMGCAGTMFDSAGALMNRSFSTGNLPKLRFRDHIWTYTQRYKDAEAVEDAIIGLEGKPDPEDGNGDGMRLVQLLISCAEAVACRDKAHASALLSELRADALVFGSSFQRVASCFVQGLTDRLALVHPLGTVGLIEPAVNKMDFASEKKEEALRLVYEICPHIQFGHFVANSTILEAFEGESFVHVVDLGMTLGLPNGSQWRDLIDDLAKRRGPPVHWLRITGVGVCAGQFQIIGNKLEAYAHKLGMNLEFSVVETVRKLITYITGCV